ncbi:HesA/MoeB/ThiF family protein [Propionivibrio dicarboxylicus]|uniref:Molybdopterin-synthase adenylyltransferase n=1 Tax=Propionivibrio dicarboxylicus TaxID=83767 RepID=A0A1G8D808_9RHOO|nr:molybdopterin-synthase adenylyltransferase MoeB [Propionivibrio dicarboxylicus]SDH53821.1 Molybdopterin or thiamine biosynthesis adenylyltransferase [Propionivibrio dicarboxylicus]
MNDEQLLRYSRHILLDAVGIEGQTRLLQSHALIIGVGGLGSPVSMYLAASGVGRLTLCDHDQVDLSNLQRQIVHRTSAIGLPKVASAEHTLKEINPEVVCTPVAKRVDETELGRLVAEADVVLDCSDNFATRYAVNRVCRKLGKPLVSGAAILMHGQVSVFDFRRTDVPCYNCLFPEGAEVPELRCATTGVLAPLVGLVGTIQAAEALKLLVGMERGLSGALLLVDAIDMDFSRNTVSRDPSCCVCATLNTTDTEH